MISDEIWAELGLSPTHDRILVRRAYAQRLKLTNPEDDPERFKRLREAYEKALVWVDGQGAMAEPPAARGAPDPPTALAAPQQSSSHSDARPYAADLAAADPFADHWARCNTLLQAVEAGGGSDEQLLADLDVILKSPVLEHLEVFQQTGHGLAQAICSLSPKADLFVWPVLTHFGWRKVSQGWPQAPEVRALQDLGRRATDRQSMRDNRAYRLLTSPPPRRANRDMRWERASVMSLLRAARSEDAWLMEELRPDSVKWWERYGDPDVARRRKRNIVLAIIAGVIGLLVVAVVTDDPSAPQSEPESGRYEEAERLAAVADENTHDPVAWAKLCAVTARHWWRETSINDCDHAATLNPGAADTQLDRGFLYVKIGEAHAARRQFDKMLLDYPDNALALVGRSLARSMANDVEGGRGDWCKALKLDPAAGRLVSTTYEFRIDGDYAPC